MSKWQPIETAPRLGELGIFPRGIGERLFAALMGFLVTFAFAAVALAAFFAVYVLVLLAFT